MLTLPQNEIIQKEKFAHANISYKDSGSKPQNKNEFHFTLSANANFILKLIETEFFLMVKPSFISGLM